MPLSSSGSVGESVAQEHDTKGWGDYCNRTVHGGKGGAVQE